MNENATSPIKDLLSRLNLSSLSIPSIKFTDIIDVIIVAVLIYIIIHWIKETRAWTLFRGLLVIVFISFFGYYFHLYTLTWIIEKTLSVGIIAVIIIFQPELRKALEQIGTGKFSDVTNMLYMAMPGNKLTKDIIDEIFDACISMSKSRTGAIIAIERSVPMGDIVNASGVNIDGLVSKQLIVNIFEDKTPLHDGAVIIRNDRIAAASCILPVTQSEIGQELGTRHRAAVGGSETSDGYFIVVSEETGAISLAQEGKLYKGLTEMEFRNKLNQLIVLNKTPALNINKIWKGLNKNE